MGTRRKAGGVELRKTTIRINFTWNGEFCRETLDLSPSAGNAKYAARLVEEIRQRIKLGVFDYGSYFPESPRARRVDAARAPRSFGHYCQLYLDSMGRSAAATQAQYRNALAACRTFKPLSGNCTKFEQFRRSGFDIRCVIAGGVYFVDL